MKIAKLFAIFGGLPACIGDVDIPNGTQHMHTKDIEQLHTNMLDLVAKARGVTTAKNAQVFANANLTADASNQSIKLAADKLETADDDGISHAIAKVVTGLQESKQAITIATERCEAAGETLIYCMGVAVGVQAIAALGFTGFAWRFSPVYAQIETTTPPQLLDNTIPTTTVAQDPNVEMKFDIDLSDADTCEGKTKGDMKILDKYPDLLKQNSATRNQTANTINAEMKGHLQTDLACVVKEAHHVTVIGSQMGLVDLQNAQMYTELQQRWQVANDSYTEEYNHWLKKWHDWNTCTFWCFDPEPQQPHGPRAIGGPPNRTVPENFRKLSSTMKSELQDFEADVIFVTTCSGAIAVGGCEPFQLSDSLEKLQRQFKTIHIDWLGYKGVLCDFHAWTICPDDPSLVLAALRNVRKRHQWTPDTIEFEVAAELVPAGYSHAAPQVAPLGLCLAVAMMVYVVAKSKWRKRETPGGLKPLLEAVQA